MCGMETGPAAFLRIPIQLLKSSFLLGFLGSGAVGAKSGQEQRPLPRFGFSSSSDIIPQLKKQLPPCQVSPRTRASSGVPSPSDFSDH